MLLTTALLLTSPVAAASFPPTWTSAVIEAFPEDTQSDRRGDWEDSDWDDSDWETPPAPTTYELDVDLRPFGEWLTVDGFRVWRPYNMAPGWQPYTHGHWVDTEVGWTWVSLWSWGQFPFHYGRWQRNDRYGWVWYPGVDWAPAWVAWRYDAGWVAWAPLPPTVTWTVELGTFVNVAQFVGSFDPYLWVTVGTPDFLRSDIRPCVWSVSRTREVIRHSQVQLPYHYDRRHRWLHHDGVPVSRIEHAVGRRVSVERQRYRRARHNTEPRRVAPSPSRAEPPSAYPAHPARRSAPSHVEYRSSPSHGSSARQVRMAPPSEACRNCKPPPHPAGRARRHN